MRVVRCTIEMDLVEGEHFNPTDTPSTDEETTYMAVSSFVDTLRQIIEDENPTDHRVWVQAKIVGDKS